MEVVVDLVDVVVELASVGTSKELDVNVAVVIVDEDVEVVVTTA